MAEKVCPVWVGYLLSNPVRKLFQNPKNILSPYVEEGMKVLDIGCAMGFFSLPLAQLVGPNGKVVCVDLQEKMIKSLEKRAHKAGLGDRIETRLCCQDSLGLDNLREEVDFALAFAVIHEVPDASRLFSEIHRTLKPRAIALVAEPKGHVSAEDFEMYVSIAKQSCFEPVERPTISYSLSVLISKKPSGVEENTKASTRCSKRRG